LEEARILEWQTLSAIAIAVVAALWLARRWWRHGFDDEEHGCTGCDAVKPLERSAAGPSRGGRPHERPVGRDVPR
jgi:hypothetical protein